MLTSRRTLDFCVSGAWDRFFCNVGDVIRHRVSRLASLDQKVVNVLTFRKKGFPEFSKKTEYLTNDYGRDSIARVPQGLDRSGRSRSAKNGCFQKHGLNYYLQRSFVSRDQPLHGSSGEAPPECSVTGRKCDMLKWKVLRTVVRPAAFYGPECCPVKKEPGRRPSNVQTKLLR